MIRMRKAHRRVRQRLYEDKDGDSEEGSLMNDVFRTFRHLLKKVIKPCNKERGERIRPHHGGFDRRRHHMRGAHMRHPRYAKAGTDSDDDRVLEGDADTAGSEESTVAPTKQ